MTSHIYVYIYIGSMCMGGYGVCSVVWDTKIERYHFFV